MATFQIPDLPDVPDNSGDRVMVIQADDELGLVPGYIRSINGDTGPDVTVTGPTGPPGPTGETGASGAPGPNEANLIVVTDAGGYYDSSEVESVLQEIGVGTATAAQRTAVDSTLGRLAIDNAQIGDTGWRSVTLENSWTGTLYVRRSANTVQVWAKTALDGTSATDNVFYSLPSGFRPAGYVYAATPTGLITWARTFVAAVGGAAGSAHRSTGLDVSHTFLTDNAWPTSLPGTQVTAPLDPTA